MPATPFEVNEFHRFDDLDSAPDAHHHTLGRGPNQAAAGNHSHANDPGSGDSVSKTVTAEQTMAGALKVPYFTVLAQPSAGDEGGEILLTKNPGGSVPGVADWAIDVYRDDVRFHTQGQVPLIIKRNGDVFAGGRKLMGILGAHYGTYSFTSSFTGQLRTVATVTFVMPASPVKITFNLTPPAGVGVSGRLVINGVTYLPQQFVGAYTASNTGGSIPVNSTGPQVFGLSNSLIAAGTTVTVTASVLDNNGSGTVVEGNVVVEG